MNTMSFWGGDATRPVEKVINIRLGVCVYIYREKGQKKQIGFEMQCEKFVNRSIYILQDNLIS